VDVNVIDFTDWFPISATIDFEFMQLPVLASNQSQRKTDKHDA
jgi:hypothetical protein